MNSEKKTATILHDHKMDVRIKLAGAWITMMFLYIYVDHFYLYVPEVIENIIAGMVWKFEITQAWALSSMIMMTIPIVMIFLSLTLKAKANRWANIIVGILYIVVVIGNVVGETWAFYVFGSIVELVLLSQIVWSAWKWPKQEA